MRKLGFTLASIAVVTGFAALVLAQSSGQPILDKYTDLINKADGLSVDFSTLKPGEAPVKYSVTLGKPNLAKIDSATKLVVADGKTITTLDKATNSYYSTPETDTDLKKVLQGDGLELFAPFFDAKALPASSAVDKGTIERKSMTMQKVTFPLGGSKRTATAYIGKADGLIHQAEIASTVPNSMSGSGVKTSILDTSSIALSTKVSPDQFAFKAPDGAKEITADDLNATNWLSDLNEAEALAAKTNKKVFVDFMASWCGPCKMLDREVLSTDGFKKLSKYFVFCRIDVDQQPSVAAQYMVDAMPTQMVLDAQGTMLDKIVGYGGPDMFYSFINKYVPAS